MSQIGNRHGDEALAEPLQRDVQAEVDVYSEANHQISFGKEHSNETPRRCETVTSLQTLLDVHHAGNYSSHSSISHTSLPDVLLLALFVSSWDFESWLQNLVCTTYYYGMHIHTLLYYTHFGMRVSFLTRQSSLCNARVTVLTT